MDQTGKTTQIMEEAVDLLAELPDTHTVFITGPYEGWLRDLEHEFMLSGLVDVKFLSPTQIQYGALRGQRGVLLIDDVAGFAGAGRYKELTIIHEEKRVMEYKSKIQPRKVD